jgi:hypothetical protein
MPSVEPRPPFRVRIEDIQLKPNIPAGMDPCVVLGLVPLLRKTAQDHAPVLVRAHTQAPWLLLDGRHRFMASVIAGRCDILAIEETP